MWIPTDPAPDKWRRNVDDIRRFVSTWDAFRLSSTGQKYRQLHHMEAGGQHYIVIGTECSGCGAEFSFCRSEEELVDVFWLPRRCRACWSGSTFSALRRAESRELV